MGNIWRVIVACAVLSVTATVLAQERQAPFRKGDPGVSDPILTKEVHPRYTREAMQARIEGTIEMDAVVREDGSVGDVTITRSLDDKYGLDEEAVKAMKQWQFKPGTKDDKPVTVVVSVTMSFTLK
ncbi:MAG TPA: energy transducer TonB [Vicinamibacterales bacterium]|nr:energy transducer TonB [Vicinamibacterales bacterium]